MSSDIAIRVTNVSKCYQIYDKPQDRLKQFILPHVQRLVGQKPKPYYHEFWSLKDIEFKVNKGETVGIIGRNGAGKSTLLQIICGTVTPTSGSVEINGRVAALLELGAGFNPEFTGRENVYMNATLLGLSRQEIDARFDKIAAFADIGEFIEQPVKIYSSGMYVRLAFAVIAHVDADILVIDEALSVGDVFFNQKCMLFLRNFMQKGTVLFVSHDTGAVTSLCKRAIWLKSGHIYADDAPKYVTQKYLEELYSTRQKVKGIEQPVATETSLPKSEATAGDQRLKFLNGTKYRNDIEVIKMIFQSNAFGTGGATIQDVKMCDTEGQPLTWIVGGEQVIIHITCLANKDIINPIIGFGVKDRLGQVLFGDNSFISYSNALVTVKDGQKIIGEFAFVMPILPVGDYTVSVAIAEGTQDDHVQHHWLHDAISFKSHSSSVSTGLIGIPMNKILIQVGG